MTHAELARKIREAVYERANTEGGAISREQMDDAIEGALAAAMPAPPTPAWGYVAMMADGKCDRVNVGPGGLNVSSTGAANRVILTNQTDPTINGVYEWTEPAVAYLAEEWR